VSKLFFVPQSIIPLGERQEENVKEKKLWTYSVAILMTFSLMACNLPTGMSSTTPDIDATVAAKVAVEWAAETMVAGTLAAGGKASGDQANNPPPSNNDIEFQPSDTATLTVTPTITLTPTPEGVFLVLSADTNCRKGAPYMAFPIVVTVKAGEKVKVLSRNPENDSYFVVNPYNSNSQCWLYGKYATLSGDATSLPVSTMQATPTFTPTPTPEPDFIVSYVGLENCGPNWAFKLFIKNTSNNVWQSIQMSGTDTVTGFLINDPSNSFKDSLGCIRGEEQGDLTKGEFSYVINSNSFFNYNPTGHLINITVRLCTQDNFLGTCVAKNLSFTP